MDRLLNDESVKGLEKAVWWIEYVIRNNGARHFRNPIIDMSWFEFLMLDVYGFLILTSCLIGFLIYKVLAAVFISVPKKFKTL